MDIHKYIYVRARAVAFRHRQTHLMLHRPTFSRAHLEPQIRAAEKLKALASLKLFSRAVQKLSRARESFQFFNRVRFFLAPFPYPAIFTASLCALKRNL